MSLKRSVVFRLPLRQFSLLLLSERDILGLFPETDLFMSRRYITCM